MEPQIARTIRAGVLRNDSYCAGIPIAQDMTHSSRDNCRLHQLVAARTEKPHLDLRTIEAIEE
jgi:hypothetical protein